MKIKFFSTWNNVWVSYIEKYFAQSKHDVEFCVGDQINVKKLSDADVAVFMWANEQTISLSKQRLKYCKKYVVFCRSYEIFYGYLKRLRLENIDDLIFVNPSFAKEFGSLKTRTHFLPNAIDLDKWKFQEHKKGFNLAMVANLNHKKGIDLIPQFIKKLNDIDPRYKLHIAGETQETRHVLYMAHVLDEMKNENVILHGMVKNIQEWLKDKDYLFTCSVTEGHPNNVIEAMSLGIKPLIHNWLGATGTFPKYLIWNDIDTAVKMITEDKYEGEKYRKYIEDNYDIWKVYPELERIIEKEAI